MLFVIRTLFVAFFALLSAPALAAGNKCENEPVAPLAVSIETVQAQYPNLDASQQNTIAGLYELVFNQQQIADDANAPESLRAIALRTKEVAVTLTAVELAGFDALRGMKSVLGKMEAEKAAGLKEVSETLKPEVRASAHTVIKVTLAWGELGQEMGELSIARASALAKSQASFPERAAQIEGAMCVFEKVTKIMVRFAELLPSAQAFAYVEHLNY